MSDGHVENAGHETRDCADIEDQHVESSTSSTNTRSSTESLTPSQSGVTNYFFPSARDTNQMNAIAATANSHRSVYQSRPRPRSLSDGMRVRRDVYAYEEKAESCLYQEPPPTNLPPSRHFSVPVASVQPSQRTSTRQSSAYVMGNAHSEDVDSSTQRESRSSRDARESQRPRSNLTALLDQQSGQSSIGGTPVANVASPAAAGNPGTDSDFRPVPGRSILKRQPMVYEADSASGPVCPGAAISQTAPATARQTDRTVQLASTVLLPPPSSTSSSVPSSTEMTRRSSWSEMPLQANRSLSTALAGRAESSRAAVRRCFSSKELGTLAPPSGSPYAYMLYQREVLEATMQERLMAVRESAGSSRSFTPSPAPVETSNPSDEARRQVNVSSKLTNEARNRRRAEHNRAVIRDLCEIVTDLFVAESKLLNPSSYGVQSSFQREHVLRSVQQFLSALPPRYALGADTPSEVLLHMRLMAAARSDDTRAVVHIVDPEGGTFRGDKTTAPTHTRPQTVTRLVTIACADARGLLEYITNLLSTGGSRVIDADVMLTSDNIVLDRFMVEMNGRLRLDKLANCIEAFLKQAKESEASEVSTSSPLAAEADDTSRKSLSNSPEGQTSGPLYYHPPSRDTSPREIHEEIQGAVPLTEVLASSNSINMPFLPMRGRSPRLLRQQSLPNPPPGHLPRGNSGVASQQPDVREDPADLPDQVQGDNRSMRNRRPLVNREASDFSGMGLDNSYELGNASSPLEGLEQHVVQLIPFEELMLIETLGMGRVSTIYRAAWQKQSTFEEANAIKHVKMVALKVASVNPDTGDTSHVDELRREADIAAMLHHTNVCDLVGVAADAECFCLAYDFCEGGSLLSLLLDTTRYYEYLPIALDIANGMAYLHHCNVIHRDLKPSNILLDGDHRAKISDFGMSVANTGQELTAETGTYRYMAPEVIRHETYSSNADVYSFGIVLWQLITREVPFGTMTPIQAAWAVAEGRRPEIPPSTPPRLREIICACWNQDSHKRPSFTYIAMALADYAKMAFSPANVGAQTLHIANEMLANVQGNSTVNVDFSTPVALGDQNRRIEMYPRSSWFGSAGSYSSSTNVGLEI